MEAAFWCEGGQRTRYQLARDGSAARTLPIVSASRLPTAFRGPPSPTGTSELSVPDTGLAMRATAGTTGSGTRVDCPRWPPRRTRSPVLAAGGSCYVAAPWESVAVAVEVTVAVETVVSCLVGRYGFR